MPSSRSVQLTVKLLLVTLAAACLHGCTSDHRAVGTQESFDEQLLEAIRLIGESFDTLSPGVLEVERGAEKLSVSFTSHANPSLSITIVFDDEVGDKVIRAGIFPPRGKSTVVRPSELSKAWVAACFYLHRQEMLLNQLPAKFETIKVEDGYHVATQSLPPSPGAFLGVSIDSEFRPYHLLRGE